MAVTDLINPSTHIGNAIHLLLTFLEKISEENVWKSILGERLVNLGQKYFGNDFVALSLAIYIAPILKTHWHNLVEMLFKKVINTDTVSVKIYSTNSLYNNISKYIFEHGPSRGNLTTGVAEYSSGCGNYTSTDYYDADDFASESEFGGSTARGSECDDDAMKVKLLPPPSFVEEITYKGHVISSSFNAYTEDVGEHIELTMRGTNTRLLHTFIQEWSFLYNTTTVTKYVYRANGCCWNYERELPERSLDSVHLRDGQKEKLITDMETFRGRAEWYRKRGIPHRRGYLLYGPPGTGKSSIIQAIANELGLHVAFSSLTGIGGNDALSSLMSDLPYNSIMVIEDIDHLFESVSDKKATSSSLTMSGLLNVLDGLQSREGSMIFMTCNNIDKIQPALLRPGRIDLKFKLDYAAPEQIRDTFWRFMNLDDETSLPLGAAERAKVEKIALEFEKRIPEYHVTTAEIQGYFINLLLSSKANDWSQDDLHREIFERIPEFMNQVKLDREQAKKHSGEKDEEKKDDEEEEKKDDDEEEKKDDKEEEKKDDKEEEKKDEKKDVEEDKKAEVKAEEKKEVKEEEKKEVKEEEKKEVKEEVKKEAEKEEVKKDEDDTKNDVEKTE